MMRLNRPWFGPKKMGIRRSTGRRSPLTGRLERNLIRGIVICTVILVVFQIFTFTDPVDFYLKIAGDIDSPAFKYDEYVEQDVLTGEQGKKVSLNFQVEPDSAVVVKQNDKTIGILSNNTNLDVQPGTVYLDATHIPYPVTVNITLNDKKHRLQLNGDIKSFNIELKTKESS
jgi:hypothetical protein